MGSNDFNTTQGARARAGVIALEASQIREVSNLGASVARAIPLWFGEPDQVTPAFIREAAKRALDEGRTFYGANLGLTQLRAAISQYQYRLGRRSDLDRVSDEESGRA